MGISSGVFSRTQARRSGRVCGWKPKWTQLGYVLRHLLEIMKWTPNRQSRWASAWKLEWKGTQGVRLGFPQKFSVVPELGEVEGCMVGKSEWTPAQVCTPGFCWKLWNGP